MTPVFIYNAMTYRASFVALKRHMVDLRTITYFFLGKPILNLLGFLGERDAHSQPLAEKDNNREDL